MEGGATVAYKPSTIEGNGAAWAASVGAKVVHTVAAVANEVRGRRGRRCLPLLIANSWPPLCTPPIN